ncbi:MAG: hypothetical protein ACYC1C_09785 [Chloroflexota bacterium]
MYRRWQIPILALALLALTTACQSAAASTSGDQATPAAAQGAPAASNLFLMVDTVQGSTNLPADAKATQSCVLNNRFPRNSQVVWRGRVFDPQTGELMDDKALSKVEIQLGNGQMIAMHYGSHPKDPPGEAYWTGSWVIPTDQATGTLDYKVVAESADGRTGDFEPFQVPTSLLTVTDEVLPASS